MRLHAGVLAVIVALLAGGCILPIPHLDKTCGAIDGRVLDKATGLPIAGAEVSVAYDEGAPTTKVTGVDGGFHFGAKYEFWPILYIGPRDCMYSCVLRVKAAGFAEGLVRSHSFVQRVFPVCPETYPDAVYEDGLLTFRLRRVAPSPSEKTSPE
jgi:hypothetical protein